MTGGLPGGVHRTVVFILAVLLVAVAGAITVGATLPGADAGEKPTFADALHEPTELTTVDEPASTAAHTNQSEIDGERPVHDGPDSDGPADDDPFADIDSVDYEAPDDRIALPSADRADYTVELVGGQKIHPEPGLDDALVDPARLEDPFFPISNGSVDTSSVVLALVQFDGGFDATYVDQLEQLEYDLAADLTHTTHLAGLPQQNLRDVAALPFVRSVTNVDADLKVEPGLRTDAPAENGTNRSVIVTTVGEIDTNELGLTALEEAKPTATGGLSPEELKISGVDPKTYRFEQFSTRQVYLGNLSQAAITALAASPRVMWIETWEPPTTDVDDATTAAGASSTDVLPNVDNWDGTNTAVGVLDSGIQVDHPHFENTEVLLSYDWTYDLMGLTNPQTDQDRSGHGTHVAGIIAGEHPDGNHQGVAPETTLVASRVLDDPDFVGSMLNPHTFFTDESVYVGPITSPDATFDRVLQTGAQAGIHVDVVSNSWGAGKWLTRTGYSYTHTEPIDNWARKNPYTLVVFSNGNWPDQDYTNRQAVGKNVLSVGAVDNNLDVHRLNNLEDPEPDRDVKPDVNAPGVGMVSATSEHDSAYDHGTYQYASKSGTSMATPLVSGLAARYIGYKKAERGVDKVRANEVKTALIASTTGQLNSNEHRSPGWGTVNDQKLYHLAHTPGNQITSVVEDDEVNVHSIDVPAEAEHVEVTLSWTEKPNRLTTSYLRNDLHLYLTNEDADEVIEIDEGGWFSSDEVIINVDEPLQVDNQDDRTVRRVAIPTHDIEPGEWTILVHADSTAWNRDSVLYDIAIDMQGERDLTVESDNFRVDAGEQTTVRLDLHGGWHANYQATMIPAITPGVQVEDLSLTNGDLCGWEVGFGGETIDSGDGANFAVGTVSGRAPHNGHKYVDVCVEAVDDGSEHIELDYVLSYVDYPYQRVSDRTEHSATGIKRQVTGSTEGQIRETEDSIVIPDPIVIDPVIDRSQFDPLSDDLVVILDDIDQYLAFDECEFIDDVYCELSELELFDSLADETVGITVDDNPRMAMTFDDDSLVDTDVVDEFDDDELETELVMDADTKTDIVYSDDRIATMQQAYEDGKIEIVDPTYADDGDATDDGSDDADDDSESSIWDSWFNSSEEDEEEDDDDGSSIWDNWTSSMTTPSTATG